MHLQQLGSERSSMNLNLPKVILTVEFETLIHVHVYRTSWTAVLQLKL